MLKRINHYMQQKRNERQALRTYWAIEGVADHRTRQDLLHLSKASR